MLILLNFDVSIKVNFSIGCPLSPHMHANHSDIFLLSGTEASIDELAESILAGPLAGKLVQKDKVIRFSHDHFVWTNEQKDVFFKRSSCS